MERWHIGHGRLDFVDNPEDITLGKKIRIRVRVGLQLQLVEDKSHPVSLGMLCPLFA